MPRNETIPRQAGKRPIKPLSAQEKVNAIKRVHEGESKASVARDIGVPESTLRGWCKAQHKLFNQAKNQSNSLDGSIQQMDSASDDDRSSLRSGSSRSPPTNGNVITGVSNLPMREASNDDAEIVPSAKRAKLTDNCTTPVVTNSMSNLINTSSSPAHGLHYNGDLSTLHYQRLINVINSNPETARLLQQNSFYNAFNMNFLNAQNGIQYSTRNNGAVSSMSMVNNPVAAANAIVANNVVLNGVNNENKRKHSSTARPVLSRRHLPSIVDTGIAVGTERSVTPMTSGVTNGSTIESSTSRPRQENRSFDEIMHQLQAQQIQQQQNAISEIVTQAYQRMCTMIVMKNEENGLLERKKRLEEALQQNKNTHDENERNRPNGIPIGIDTALNQAQSLEKWLKEYGSPYFTFENVRMLQIIINKLQGWMEGSKSEGRSKNNANTAS